MNYTKRLIGYRDKEPIYLDPPSWDCGWYWGFGYLGNKNCHYHVDGLKKIEKYNFEKEVWEYELVDLYDGFIKHFGDSLTIRPSDLWKLCELFQTFYVLKETAEVLGRGGSHYTTNPCKDVIINKDEVERINKIVLPEIFKEIYKILDRNSDNKTLFSKIVEMNVQGDTTKVVDFMLKNKIHTDDLRVIKELTSKDFHNIHSYYWTKFHKEKTN